MITIHSNFDGGNIGPASFNNSDNLRLNICKDAGDQHGQWFSFQLCLEMPFKDTAKTPMPDIGWSPGRSRVLGAAFVDAIDQTVVENRE